MVVMDITDYNAATLYSVVLPILHCVSNSAIEALYHSVPVICFQSAFEQFDVAYRLESQGLGKWFIPSKLHDYL